MSEQREDETKSGKIAPTTSQPNTVGKSKKDPGHLPDDELSKISGGTVDRKPDAY